MYLYGFETMGLFILIYIVPLAFKRQDDAAYSLVLYAIFAMSGDKIYLYHTKNKINKIKEFTKDSNEWENKIKSEGGTSTLAPWLVFIAMLILSLISQSVFKE